MITVKQLLIVLIIAIIAMQAGAHGEDRLGPNGGYIKMPGAFHTELVPAGKNAFKVYLLDLEWKNPSTKNSSVILSFHSAMPIEAKCGVEKKFYLCRFDQTVDLTKKGELSVQAKREGQVGNEVKYSLPLTLEGETDHSKHKM